jgi:hypothetical protein
MSLEAVCEQLVAVLERFRAGQTTATERLRLGRRIWRRAERR